MPLKKDEMEERELRRQVSQQNAQKRGDAQEWDDIRSHRKDKKDDVWDKSNKYKEHMAKPKYRKKEGGMAEYEVPKGKQAKMRKAADDAETDRKMQEAMAKYKKTRVGGGKKEDKPKMAMGGSVRQAVMPGNSQGGTRTSAKAPAPGSMNRSAVMPGRASFNPEMQRSLAAGLGAVGRGGSVGSGRMAKGGAVAKPKAKAYAKGGKVRGCGMAKQGVRKAKMY